MQVTLGQNQTTKTIHAYSNHNLLWLQIVRIVRIVDKLAWGNLIAHIGVDILLSVIKSGWKHKVYFKFVL